MKAVYILPLLVALAHSQMDMDFCAKRFKPTHNTETISVAEPPVYDDFSVFLEFTNATDPNVGFARYWYSHTYNLIQRTLKISDFDALTIMFPAKGIFLDSTATNGSYRTCQADSYQHSIMAEALNLPDPKTHRLRTPAVPYMIPSIQRSPPMFVRKTTMRGIPAQEWFLCSFDENNVTQAAYIYFSDDGVLMPGSLGKVPLALHYEAAVDGNLIYKGRYDYTMFVDKLDPKDKDLEIPAGLYCKNRTSANNDMPEPPESYQYESVLKESTSTPPKLKYFKHTSDIKFSIEVTDQVIVGSKTITGYRSRSVSDYRTGLEYQINLSTGNCTVQKLPTSTEHAFEELRHGHFNKHAPFFSLPSDKFQYMGKHRYFDRDIEADVYTTVEIVGKNETMATTYWMASTDFLQQIGLKKNDYMLLRYHNKMMYGDEVFTAEADFYHFTTDIRQGDVFPDVSACYNAGNPIYVDIVLKGHYKLLYSRSPGNFQDAFRTAMLNYTGVESHIRMAGFRVTPADEGYTRVQFTLLDKPSIMGSSETGGPEPGNDVVWPKLEHSLETAQFQVSVRNDLGHHIAKAVRYSRDFQDPTTYNAKKANLKAASEQSSRFSPGSMAGIGIVMLLLGLLAGFGSMKGVKRYMDKVPDHIGMQEFKNEA